MISPVTSTIAWTWPRPLGLPGSPGSGTVRLSPSWQGSVLPCPGVPLGSWLHSSQGAAGPCSTLTVGFSWCIWILLFRLSLLINTAISLKWCFCTVPFRFSLHISHYYMKQSDNYLFYVCPYPFLFSGWIHEWKRKNISLSLCHGRGKAASALFPDCALVQKLDKIRFCFKKAYFSFPLVSCDIITN